MISIIAFFILFPFLLLLPELDLVELHCRRFRYGHM